MGNPDRRASEEDLAEFGDAKLAGAPSIAALIGVLPEDAREAYRQERRAALVEIVRADRPSLPNHAGLVYVPTWREYLERGADWLAHLRYAKPEPDSMLDSLLTKINTDCEDDGR